MANIVNLSKAKVIRKRMTFISALKTGVFSLLLYNNLKRSHLPDEEGPGLVRASQQTLAPLIEKEADIYTVADLKVRFR